MAEVAVGAEPVEVEPTAGARTRGSPASTGPEARPPCHDDPASAAHPRISTVLACRGAHREEVASGHVEEPEAPTPQGERAEGDDERAEGPDLADRDPNRSADDLGSGPLRLCSASCWGAEINIPGCLRGAGR